MVPERVAICIQKCYVEFLPHATQHRCTQFLEETWAIQLVTLVSSVSFKHDTKSTGKEKPKKK